jgi:hypothetical protein
MNRAELAEYIAGGLEVYEPEEELHPVRPTKVIPASDGLIVVVGDDIFKVTVSKVRQTKK